MSICVSLRRRMWTALAAVVLLLAVGASVARASTVLKVTFSEAVASAEIVAVGTVSAIEETWDAERRVPFTLVTFLDLEVLKGEAGTGNGRLTLQFVGGLLPSGARLVIAGMPRFRVNEQFVVFSAGNRVRVCPLVGWSQGLYRVIQEVESDVPVVTDYAGNPVFSIEGEVGARVTRVLPVRQAPVSDALTLEQFKRLIRREF